MIKIIKVTEKVKIATLKNLMSEIPEVSMNSIKNNADILCHLGIIHILIINKRFYKIGYGAKPTRMKNHKCIIDHHLRASLIEKIEELL